MKIKLQVVVESDDGQPQIIQKVTEIERSYLQYENLGLNLTEAKIMLKKV